MIPEWAQIQLDETQHYENKLTKQQEVPKEMKWDYAPH